MNKSTKGKWVKVDDIHIRHVWRHGDDVVHVSPDWYEANGTPTSDDGEDYEYSHTEIFSGPVVIEVLGGVAECTSQPKHVAVEIIDHDNENCK